MLIIKAILVILFNLIIYFAFGSLLCKKRDGADNPAMIMTVGFFAYYSLFAVFAMPIMLTYRPLSLLTKLWMPFVLAVLVLSVILCRKRMADSFRLLCTRIEAMPKFYVIIAAIILLQTVVIVMSYDFTLDAAYYVANVTTSVDTNMINVYDPFTGAWQDHFELRYAFATYSINDAVICQITGLPALIQTKTVMASTVVILVNLVYAGIADTLFEGDMKKITIMMTAVTWINFTFITIYTASNFFVSRTYEGKAIVGNLSVVLILWLFIELIKDKEPDMMWLILFIISFGSTSITSSANMLIPAELSVLFVPYIVMNRTWKNLPKLIMTLLPGAVMLIVYVLYVKGYFAVYTYPRY